MDCGENQRNEADAAGGLKRGVDCWNWRKNNKNRGQVGKGGGFGGW